MKRRLLLALFPLFALLLLLSVPAYAMTLSSDVQTSGDFEGTPATFFGTFKTKDSGMNDYERDMLRQFFEFPEGRCLVTYTEGNFISENKPAILFLFFNETYTIFEGNFRNGSFCTNGDMSCTAIVFSYPDLEFCKLLGYTNATGSDRPLGKLLYAGFDIKLISDDGSDCQIDYDTDLIVFRDDSGIMGDPEPPPTEDGGILGWLKGFWDKFVEVIVGLFVPKEGYFDDWFQSLRDAFNAKLGGLGDFFTSIGNAFKNLKGESGGLYIALPANFLYQGFAGVKVNLLDHMQMLLDFLRPILTALVVILTLIYGYKKIIGFANR